MAGSSSQGTLDARPLRSPGHQFNKIILNVIVFMDLERSLFDYLGGVRSDLDEIYDWEILSSGFGRSYALLSLT